MEISRPTMLSTPRLKCSGRLCTLSAAPSRRRRAKKHCRAHRVRPGRQRAALLLWVVIARRYISCDPTPVCEARETAGHGQAARIPQTHGVSVFCWITTLVVAQHPLARHARRPVTARPRVFRKPMEYQFLLGH